MDNRSLGSCDLSNTPHAWGVMDQSWGPLTSPGAHPEGVKSKWSQWNSNKLNHTGFPSPPAVLAGGVQGMEGSGETLLKYSCEDSLSISRVVCVNTIQNKLFINRPVCFRVPAINTWSNQDNERERATEELGHIKPLW